MGSNKSIRLSIFEWIVLRYLGRLRGGTLRLELTSGRVENLGDGKGTEVDLKMLDEMMPRRLVLGGSMALGEGYVNASWTTSDLSALLTLLARNQYAVGRIRKGLLVLGHWLDRLYHRRRSNTRERSKSNIEAHYDLSNDFYALFLDPTMTYSSALYERRAEESLEAAQIRKIETMLRRSACPREGHLLEIGTGWGALALRAAQAGCRVTSLTLSQAQLAYAKELIEQAGFDEQVNLKLQDYRDEKGQYDAVVSCEMIEAVGRKYLPKYFQTIRDCLKPGGMAVVQAITISDDRYAQYCRSCDWIQRYIFPGGHLPSKSYMRSIVDDLGGMEFEIAESFGLDYAETLRRWRDAFNEHETELEALGFDASFRRKWNYYLSYCEAGFETGSIDVSQIVVKRLVH
ncbi:MAG: Tuberculostearic acid methyltransferase UfaA1 [Opitutia bacterium UBA7350]|nr:MAG: Tuberculostearic acid methyltransferase UfaA1 [Opitutae bacterium UBA7350]